MKVCFPQLQGIGNMIQALPAFEAITNAGYDLSVCGQQPALSLVSDSVQKFTLTDLENLNEPFDILLIGVWSQGFLEKYLVRMQELNVETPPIIVKSDVTALQSTNEALLNLHLAASLEGINAPDTFEDIPRPAIPVQKTDCPDTPYVVFCNTALPTPNGNRKRWGSYPELAHLLSPTYQILYVGTESDKPYFDADRYPDTVTPIFDKPLMEVAYLLKNAAWVVGNDCGLTHIAGALNTPTVSIFGPTSVIKARPFGENTVVVSPRLPCSPCQFENWYPICEKTECLEAISAKEVHRVILNSADPDAVKVNTVSVTPPAIAKQKQKLAVLMRVKNGIDTIQESLESAARICDYLIIVDNGSTDGTLEYLHEFRQAHPNLFYVFDKSLLEGVSMSELNLRQMEEVIVPDGDFFIARTTGAYDEYRDHSVLESLLRATDATWGMMLDADEIVSEQITRSLIEFWMASLEYNAIGFRHVHFWDGNDTYRVDQRWKPRHNRWMWQLTPEVTFAVEKLHSPVFANLKGATLMTDYVIKHFGHLDKEKNLAKSELYKEMDAPESSNWSGRTYEHMTDETSKVLATWDETAPIETRDFGRPSALIVFLHAMGDALMATPALAKLKQDTPNLELSVMGLGRTEERDFRIREIFQNNPNVDHYVESSLDRHPLWWDTAEWQNNDLPVIHADIQRLQQTTSYDKIYIIHLQDNFTKHRIDRIAGACGKELAEIEKQMRVYPTPEEIKIADALLGDFKPFISVQRWCGNTRKSWAYLEYQKLCEWLSDRGYNLLLWDMGDPEPRVHGDNIMNMSDHIENLSVGVSASVMARAQLHIGADSFPMHLANAVEIPCLGIFEITLVSQTAPIHEKSLIAASTDAINNSDSDFIEQNRERITECADVEVRAEHLYPILEELLTN